MKTISLFDFIKTGILGSVRLGQSLEQIKSIFSKPDDVSRMSKGIYIWRYSTFEFHFGDGILISFWCDNLRYLSKPSKKQFKWDYWILRKYKSPLLLYQFLDELDRENVDFTLEGTYYTNEPTKGLPDSVTVLIKDTDVIIHFEALSEESVDVKYFQLIAIGATLYRSRYKTYPLSISKLKGAMQ